MSTANRALLFVCSHPELKYVRREQWMIPPLAIANQKQRGTPRNSPETSLLCISAGFVMDGGLPITAVRGRI